MSFYILNNNSKVQHISDQINRQDVIDPDMCKNITDIAHQRIFDPAFILKLDDSIALSLFDIKHIRAFMDADSYTSMFIHELFFPEMAVYNDIIGIKDLQACLHHYS